jgi:hypothetical protein
MPVHSRQTPTGTESGPVRIERTPDRRSLRGRERADGPGGCETPIYGTAPTTWEVPSQRLRVGFTTPHQGPNAVLHFAPGGRKHGGEAVCYDPSRATLRPLDGSPGESLPRPRAPGLSVLATGWCLRVRTGTETPAPSLQSLYETPGQAACYGGTRHRCGVRQAVPPRGLPALNSRVGRAPQRQIR